MLLSASIIASRASVDDSDENQLLEVKKSKNLDFEQKVKIDSEAPICCHEFDLSNIINWQHLGGGPLGRYFCLPRPGTLNVHLWSRFFSGFDKINNFWQQKTTFVVFKQHDPQSVADLSGVAGDPLIAPKSTQTQKNDVLGRFSAENSSPSTIWGVWYCPNFYFLKQQQKLPTFCKKSFFLSLTPKKLQSSPKKLPHSVLLDFLASFL